MKRIIRLSAILVLFGCQISGFICMAGSISKRPAQILAQSANGNVSKVMVNPSFHEVGPEPLGVVAPGALVLHDGWQMRESVIAGDNGAMISQPGFKTKNWYSTTVPTTTLGVLVRHGIYPDPYIGTNNMLIPDASDDHNNSYQLSQFSHLPDKSNPWAKPYWFRKEFSSPKEYRGKRVWLHLDGINYRADVWLNGQRVANAKSVAGMFKRFSFEVSTYLKEEGNNALAILIYPLDHAGDPVHEQLDGLAGGFGPNAGDGEILRNVTQYCTVGWDWVAAARDRNMGIWQHVWLEATGLVAVRDPAVFTDVKLPAADKATLTVRCQLDNATKVEQSVDLVVKISPDGFAGSPVEIRATTKIAAGTGSEVILKPSDYPALILNNPRLWWPVTYGDQPLYRITIEARVNGQFSSLATSQFGVRTVGTLVLPSGGRAFTVNGRTIRMTGGAWVPDFLMSWSAQRYRDEVRLMAEGNHTIVRVNGCGIVPPDVFFTECDRRGLLVWQDLARTSIQGFKFRKDGKDGWGPVDCDDPALYLNNMKDCIMRLRGHPSLLVWCGSNEKFPQADIGQPLQNDLLPTLDGTRPWLPSSEENPPWRKEDIRFWSAGPYQLVRLPEYFKLYAQDPKSISKNEIGLSSPPPINSIVRAIPDYDQPDSLSFPLNRTFGYHDATGNYYRSGDKIIRQDLGEPATLTDYLWMGDLYNSASYRAIYEAANKVRPRNSGTHIWKINAAWPSMMQQVFDWYLRPNAGYYSMRSACQPLHVQHSVDDQSVQVVSTLAEPRELRVSFTLSDITGRVEYSEEYPVSMPADTTLKVCSLPDFVKDGHLHFLGLELVDSSGRSIDHVVTWVQGECQWQELLKVGLAEVEAKVISQRHEGNETIYEVEVINHSPVPAVQVWVEVLCGPQGNEILPSFWTDNALTLLPGEKRNVTVRFRTDILGQASAHLMVEGFNVHPREIKVANNEEVLLKLKVVNGNFNVVDNILKINVTSDGVDGQRYTTWPLEVRIDGQLIRTVRVAITKEKQETAFIHIGKLPPGEHRIEVGKYWFGFLQ